MDKHKYWKPASIDVASLFSVKGKVALVTGGSSGIGLMIAQAYVEAGARVYIASRKKDICDEVARTLSEHGECHAIAADVGTAAALANKRRRRGTARSLPADGAGSRRGGCPCAGRVQPWATEPASSKHRAGQLPRALSRGYAWRTWRRVALEGLG